MEGPSIYAVAQDLAVLINQKIKKAEGNASFDKQKLVNQRIKDVFAFGKRLIFQLDDYAILMHFLMYGSYRLNETRPNLSPRLALLTAKNAAYFYSCSIKCVDQTNIKELIEFEYDILAENWNIKKVIAKIKRSPNKTIDDVLLDQEIFAGVGNIIKNEALFLSKISPYKKISQLSAKKLKEIALNTQLFSHQFLDLREKDKNLNPILKIYHKGLCPECGSKVIRKQTGKRKRWSFFCPKCQKK